MSLPTISKSNDLITFTPDQVELIKRTICNGASDDELKLFMYVAQRSGLDPFARQVHAVFRFDKNSPTGKKMSIQTGIDGYRLIADRTGKYAGNDEPVFEYEQNLQGKNLAHPSKATVTVYKIVGGVRCAFTASAYWEEYYPGDGPQGMMWRQRPKGQLSKCAEALALRKAFPAELGNIYTDAEMDQAVIEEDRQKNIVEVVNRANETDYQAQEQQIEDIRLLLVEATEGKTQQEKGMFMVNTLNIKKFDDLKKKSSSELMVCIEKLKKIVVENKALAQSV